MTDTIIEEQIKCAECGSKALTIKDIRINWKQGFLELLCFCPVCLEYRHIEIKKNGK